MNKLTPADKGRLTRLLREHRKLAGGYLRPHIGVKAASEFGLAGCPFWPEGRVQCHWHPAYPIHAYDVAACRVADSPNYPEARSLWRRFAKTEPKRFLAWARREGLEVVE